MPTLNWIGKDKVVDHHHKVPYCTLEKKYAYGDEDSGNMIIHGDNLLALKSLLPQYEGKIKCIYIDPPYNTGNEKWVYNDNVNSDKIRKWLGEVVGKEGEDLSRHDKWLCMMYPRLQLLKQLLSEDGAIFISIDDNEQANLKLLCDEVFGARNFVTTLKWKRKKQPSFLSRYIAQVMEYILVYGKNVNELEKLSIENISDATKKVINNTNQTSVRHFGSGVRVKISESGTIKKGVYTIKTMSVEYLNDVRFKEGRTIDEVDVKSQFSVSQEKINNYITNDLLFITANTGLRRDVSQEEHDNNRKAITDLLLDWGDNQDSEIELRNIFNRKVFDYSKPSKLIENIVKSLYTEDSIILDSFAGSGTTGHAVLNLNKNDGGKRKFILVEMEDYADTITAERVKRVIDGYGEGTKKTEGTGGGFVYYELGDKLMVDGYINEKQPIEKIREYIWYTETHTAICTEKVDGYYLGEYEGAGYYFYYEKEGVTTLSYETLNEIVKTKAEMYVIYADKCTIDKEDLKSMGIVFKKIPRDIRQF